MAREVIERLRLATDAETTAIAAALDVEPQEDHEVLRVRIADAFAKNGDADYRKLLHKVISELASKCHWEGPKVEDTAETEWLEEYVYLASTFAHRIAENPNTVSDLEKAKRREEAEAALRGHLPSAEQATESAAEAIGKVAAVGLGMLFWEAALAGLAVAAVAGFVWSLFDKSMKRLLPATFLLVHVRKRLEFEEVLRAQAEEVT